MSKEDINNLKEMLVDFNEYSTDYTKTRCKELEKTVENTLNEINRLNNLINELENFINNEIFTSLDKKHVFNEEADTFYKVLDKLKALKENK